MASLPFGDLRVFAAVAATSHDGDVHRLAAAKLDWIVSQSSHSVTFMHCKRWSEGFPVCSECRGLSAAQLDSVGQRLNESRGIIRLDGNEVVNVPT